MEPGHETIVVFKDPMNPTLAEYEASVERSLADIAAGRTTDAATAMRRLRKLADEAKTRMAARGKTVA